MVFIIRYRYVNDLETSISPSSVLFNLLSRYSVSNAKSKNRAVNNLTRKGAPNMEPLPELPSCDDLASSGVESWLDSSSKYHSCEIIDEE